MMENLNRSTISNSSFSNVSRPQMESTNSVPSFFNDSYLPETYFMHTKRPMLHRPFNHEIDIARACNMNKRIRLGPCPPEHQELSALKRMERETIKRVKLQGKGNDVCSAHRAMLDMPLHVVRFLQTQGQTMNRTQEAMGELISQVEDFSGKIESVIGNKESLQIANNPNSTKLRTPLVKVSLDDSQYRLFVAYYNIIREMLENFRELCPASSRQSVRSGTQYLMIQRTMECIKNIRDIIILGCNFDSDDKQEGMNFQPGHAGALVRQVSFGTPCTWEQVCSSLTRMEHNMRIYLEYLGRPGVGNRTVIKKANVAPGTLFQKPPNNKRKADDSASFNNASLEMVHYNSTVADCSHDGGRKTKTGRRFTFGSAFNPDSMEVD